MIDPIVGDQFIYAKLAASTALTVLLGGTAIYSHAANRGSACPYVVFELVTSRPYQVVGNNEVFCDETWQVRSITAGEGFAQAGSIALQVKTALSNATGTTSSGQVMRCTYESAFRFDETANLRGYRQIVQEFRIWTQ